MMIWILMKDSVTAIMQILKLKMTHLLRDSNQKVLNDLAQDLGLSKKVSELLASRLNEKN